MKRCSCPGATALLALLIPAVLAAQVNLYKPLTDTAGTSIDDALNDRWACNVIFQLTGNDAVDNHSGLQRCLDSGHSSIHLGTDPSGGNLYYTSAPLRVPPRVTRIDMAPGVAITCAAGPCLDFTGVYGGHYDLSVRKHGPITWDKATQPDSTSVGIRAANARNNEFVLRHISGFATGFLLCSGVSTAGDPCYVPGGRSAAYHNRISPLSLHDNKIGIDFDPRGDGTNSNQIVGGEIRINGGHCPAGQPVPGTRYIRFRNGSNNMNTVDATDLENECVERSVEGLQGNIYRALRLEKNRPGAFYLGPDSNFNAFYDGYIDSCRYNDTISNTAGGYGNLFFGPCGYWADTWGTAQPYWRVTNSQTEVSTVNVAADGIHITWVSGDDFSGFSKGQVVRINGKDNHANIVAIQDPKHLTLDAAIPNAPLNHVGLAATRDALTLSSDGTLFTRGGLNTNGPLQLGRYRLLTTGATGQEFEFRAPGGAWAGLRAKGMKLDGALDVTGASLTGFSLPASAITSGTVENTYLKGGGAIDIAAGPGLAGGGTVHPGESVALKVLLPGGTITCAKGQAITSISLSADGKLSATCGTP